MSGISSDDGDVRWLRDHLGNLWQFVESGKQKNPPMITYECMYIYIYNITFHIWPPWSSYHWECIGQDCAFRDEFELNHIMNVIGIWPLPIPININWLLVILRETFHPIRKDAMEWDGTNLAPGIMQQWFNCPRWTWINNWTTRTLDPCRIWKILPGSSWHRAWQGFCQLVPATLQPDILTHGAAPWRNLWRNGEVTAAMWNDEFLMVNRCEEWHLDADPWGFMGFDDFFLGDEWDFEADSWRWSVGDFFLQLRSPLRQRRVSNGTWPWIRWDGMECTLDLRNVPCFLHRSQVSSFVGRKHADFTFHVISRYFFPHLFFRFLFLHYLIYIRSRGFIVVPRQEHHITSSWYRHRESPPVPVTTAVPIGNSTSSRWTQWILGWNLSSLGSQIPRWHPFPEGWLPHYRGCYISNTTWSHLQCQPQINNPVGFLINNWGYHLSIKLSLFGGYPHNE